MTVEEVSGYLGFSVKKIYQLIEKREIPASRIGKQYRFFKDLVDNWLASRAIMKPISWERGLDQTSSAIRREFAKRGITEKDIQEEIESYRKHKHAGV